MPSIMITEVALLVCLETQRSARRRFELPTMKFSIQGLASTLAEIRDPKRRTRHNSSDVFRPLQARHGKDPTARSTLVDQGAAWGRVERIRLSTRLSGYWLTTEIAALLTMSGMKTSVGARGGQGKRKTSP
jgi:hypothetical protein